MITVYFEPGTVLSLDKPLRAGADVRFVGLNQKVVRTTPGALEDCIREVSRARDGEKSIAGATSVIIVGAAASGES